MLQVHINGLKFFVSSTLTVLEACKFVGLTIPRFCYHENLSIAGNCRMCLVELINSPKPVAACALPISNNLKIFTDTPLVKKIRENVLETLLINHPLDCPICDQGGECDLQDQTKTVGGDMSRFLNKKRSVEDKFCGPLIKTIMTRCIHCTRCVRFSTEIAATNFFGTLKRGSLTEIGSYSQKKFDSELSGNVVDLCPVGALTSKPYQFKARPWELRITESIDGTDSTGSNIYVHFKEAEILRILPKINKTINGNFISDKARFCFDANKFNRLENIYNTQTQQKLSWASFIAKIDAAVLQKKKITILVDACLDLESIYILNTLHLKNPKTIFLKIINQKTERLNFYANNWINKIQHIPSSAKICFLLSINLRLESAILNSKLRFKFNTTNLKFFGTTYTYASNFPIHFINLNLLTLLLLLEGKSKNYSKFFLFFKTPIFCFSESLSKYGLISFFLYLNIKKIINSAIILNILEQCNSESLYLYNLSKIFTHNLNKTDLIFAINLKETVSISKILKTKTYYWFNTHHTKISKNAKYVIPMYSLFEDENIYINLEKRPQKSLLTLTPTSNRRSLKTLFYLYLNNTAKQNYKTIFANIFEISLNQDLFNKINYIFNKNYLITSLNFMTKISLQPIKGIIENFYQSNNFTENSYILTDCSASFRKKATNFLH